MKKKDEPKKTGNLPKPEKDKQLFQGMMKDAVKRAQKGK